MIEHAVRLLSHERMARSRKHFNAGCRNSAG
jgi:hypothetical protein